MGYYDHDYKTDDSRGQRAKGRRGGWFTAALLGAIIGVVITFIALPALSKLGLFPYHMANATQTPTEQAEGQPGVQKKVNVDINTAITDAVDQVYDAVVGIINYQRVNFWTQEYTAEGLGSGVIYKKENGEAYIITNNHVVEGASRLEVSVDEDTKVPAVLVGRDPLMDLAVLKIDADKVKGVAEFGNSDELERGEPVVAIGNPLGFAGTVTEGVVSAVNRTVPRDTDGDKRPDWRAEVIQTDAAINPGNSGGALINLAGQVVGINSMKIAQQAVEGIGFAIPINVAIPIIKEIEKYGKVVRPYIGIFYQPLSIFPERYRKELFHVPSSVKAGLVIRSIQPGSPADQAGLKPGDVIVSMDGNRIKDALEFRKHLFTKTEPGDRLKLGVYRNGEKTQITVKLGQTS